MSGKPSLPEIAAKAAIATQPFGGAANQIVSGLQARRSHAADHALGSISERVGEDTLHALIEGDPELEALLWLALQATVATGMESKRVLLRDVVVHALQSDEPVDPDMLKALVIAELEPPHFRALARLDAAEGRGKDSVENAAMAEPFPVLTALVRNGLVYTGANHAEAEDGYLSLADPRAAGIWGVSEFGRELLGDLAERGFAGS